MHFNQQQLWATILLPRLPLFTMILVLNFFNKPRKKTNNQVILFFPSFKNCFKISLFYKVCSHPSFNSIFLFRLGQTISMIRLNFISELSSCYTTYPLFDFESYVERYPQTQTNLRFYLLIYHAGLRSADFSHTSELIQS